MQLFARTAKILTLAIFLSACSRLQNLGENFNCYADHCLRTFPAQDISEQDYWSFDTMTILPPDLAMEERTLSGEVTGTTKLPGYGQRLLVEQLDLIAKGYEIENLTLSLDEPVIEAISQLYASAWADDLTPQQVKESTSFFGVPELPAPVQQDSLALPQPLEQYEDGSCCYLLTRFSGWHHTTGAKATMVTSAAILSTMSGGSGYAGSFGSAISDMAVIRKSDGKVLWTARLISDGRPKQLRMTIAEFYSSVYNAKILRRQDLASQ